jgi:hypothetical protein
MIETSIVCFSEITGRKTTTPKQVPVSWIEVLLKIVFMCYLRDVHEMNAYRADHVCLTDHLSA